MLKKQSIIGIFLIFLGIQNSFGQYEISGPDKVVTGVIVDYTMTNLTLPISGLSFTWTVSNGTVISQNTNPNAGVVYVRVQWPFITGNGNVYLNEATNAISKFKKVAIISPAEMITICTNISPALQQAVYTLPPQQLSFPDCSIASILNVTITYQWQEALNVPDINRDPNTLPWQDITVGGTTENFTPYSMSAYAINAFRRKVTVSDAQGARVYYSNAAYVILSPLQPGSISIANNVVAYNTVPAVTQTPSFGGMCSSPAYEWEMSVNNQPWQVIGNQVGFPQTVTILDNSKVRRKVICGSDVAYTNELDLVMQYTSPWVENKNYIRVNSIRIPGVPNWYEADQLNIGKKMQNTTYLDGFGKPIQEVAKEAFDDVNNIAKDFVTHVEYDAAGRMNKNYLPYTTSTDIGFFKANAKTQQETYIRSKYNEPITAPTFYKIETEKSPLGRTLNVKEAGAAFGGTATYTGSTVQYDYNTSADNVIIWSVSNLNVPVKVDVYGAGKLMKNITYDQKQNRTITYKDFDGNIILKKVQLEQTGVAPFEEYGYAGWLSTYYVYDDYNQLRTIITPKAVKYLTTTNFVFNNTAIYKELCFYYAYDERGRVVVKHSPGAGELQYVYDNKDRAVFLQDEKQRSQNQWNFIMYDEFSRVSLAGLGNYSATRDVLQNAANSYTQGVTNVSAYLGQNYNFDIDNPIAPNVLNGMVYNTANYYDNYNASIVKTFIPNTKFAPTSANYVQTDISSSRVNGMATASITRVLNAVHDDGNIYNDKFLNATNYYNENGLPIQTLKDNLKNGQDISAMQYDWSGLMLSTFTKYNVPSTVNNYYADLRITNQYEYSGKGVLVSISKDVNNNGYKRIANYKRDEYGRLIKKVLAPDYGSNGLESLQYDYNINGNLTGINKDYALETQTATNQFAHYFGMYLGYENSDNQFADKQYNGNITGVIWRTQGDNKPSKYNYEYDRANRFIAANYLQKESPTATNWANNKMDFTVNNISYDENSNLLTMRHYGVLPANTTPLKIDDLQYTYNTVGNGTWSNKLWSVYDATTGLSGNNNGQLGDFKDEIYGVNANDFEYDANGNLIMDKNKAINSNGIVYNYLDKPWTIDIPNKSITTFTYDANGVKLSKRVDNYITGQYTITWYVGSLVFTEDKNGIALNTILTEEGRIRVYKPITSDKITISNNFSLTTGDDAVYEYFVKDHLQNTRMVLTEESHLERHKCTMEEVPQITSIKQGYEEQMFGHVDGNGTPINATNEVINTRRARPTAWSSNTSTSVSTLGKNFGKVLGPNVFLKVMAGDQLTTSVKYFYNQSPTNSGNGNLQNLVASSIFSLLTGNAQAAAVKGSSSIIQGSLQSGGALGNFISNQNQGGSTTPQAYLNVLFFDENFNVVPYNNATSMGSFGARVSNSGNNQSIQLPNIPVPQNGYVYVYLSNESNTDVYFDDFVVDHNRGQLVEENHYYAYGLRIKGLGGKAFNKGENKYGYQGSYSEEEEETEWNEFDLRMYNAQTGVWSGVDPMDEFSSPYIGMGANPVNLTDPSGGSTGGRGSWLRLFMPNGIGGFLSSLGSVAGFGGDYMIHKKSIFFQFTERDYYYCDNDDPTDCEKYGNRFSDKVLKKSNAFRGKIVETKIATAEIEVVAFEEKGKIRLKSTNSTSQTHKDDVYGASIGVSTSLDISDSDPSKGTLQILIVIGSSKDEVTIGVGAGPIGIEKNVTISNGSSAYLKFEVDVSVRHSGKNTDIEFIMPKTYNWVGIDRLTIPESIDFMGFVADYINIEDFYFNFSPGIISTRSFGKFK
jgi:RHS repeat-associated protein